MSLISAGIICKTIGLCARCFRSNPVNAIRWFSNAQTKIRRSFRNCLPEQGSSRMDTLVYYQPGLILKRRLAFRSFVYSLKRNPPHSFCIAVALCITIPDVSDGNHIFFCEKSLWKTLKSILPSTVSKSDRKMLQFISLGHIRTMIAYIHTYVRTQTQLLFKTHVRMHVRHAFASV